MRLKLHLMPILGPSLCKVITKVNRYGHVRLSAYLNFPWCSKTIHLAMVTRDVSKVIVDRHLAEQSVLCRAMPCRAMLCSLVVCPTLSSSQTADRCKNITSPRSCMKTVSLLVCHIHITLVNCCVTNEGTHLSHGLKP